MYDPVCGMEIEKSKNIKTVHKNETYFFCSNDCLKEFKSNTNHFTKEPAIRLESVWKTYNLGKVDIDVLRGLSLRIHKGDLVALVGPSGSGKSTALNLIGTLDVPSKGKAFIEGNNTANMTEDELSKLRSEKIGFVFQQFNLIPSLSAIENVMLPKIIQGDGGEKTKKRAMSLLESVNLGKRAGHKPMELSGGEQQRVAIARAFMNDPDIILADEPTGNLDSETSSMVIDLLVDLWKRYKKTLVIITHDPHVASHAEIILNFKDGQLVRNHELTEKMIWKQKGHHQEPLQKSFLT